MCDAPVQAGAPLRPIGQHHKSSRDSVDKARVDLVSQGIQSILSVTIRFSRYPRKIAQSHNRTP